MCFKAILWFAKISKVHILCLENLRGKRLFSPDSHSSCQVHYKNVKNYHFEARFELPHSLWSFMLYRMKRQILKKKVLAEKLYFQPSKWPELTIYSINMDQILNYNWVWNSTTRGLQFLAALKQLKIIPGIPSPLVVEFQTQFNFKIWSIVMEYIESSSH